MIQKTNMILQKSNLQTFQRNFLDIGKNRKLSPVDNKSFFWFSKILSLLRVVHNYCGLFCLIHAFKITYLALGGVSQNPRYHLRRWRHLSKSHLWILIFSYVIERIYVLLLKCVWSLKCFSVCPHPIMWNTNGLFYTAFYEHQIHE